MSTKGGSVFTFSLLGGAAWPPVRYATAYHTSNVGVMALT